MNNLHTGKNNRYVYREQTHKCVTPMQMHICTNYVQGCPALTGSIWISSNHRDTVTPQVCNNTYTQNIYTNIQHSRVS